jgi:uncharacterized protein DUF5658
MSSLRSLRLHLVVIVGAIVLGLSRPALAQNEFLPAPVIVPPPPAVDLPRPSCLVPMYLSFGVLQGLDIVSTQKALRRGGVEGNPLISTMVGSTAALVAVKASAGVAVVLATEHMWKRNRVAAIATAIAINSAYVTIVAHNFAIARQ